MAPLRALDIVGPLDRTGDLSRGALIEVYEEEPHPTSIHHAIESAWNEIRPADLPATTWNALERRERAFLMVVSLARRMNGGSVPKKDVEDIMKSANTPGWTQLFVPDGDRYRPKTPAE